MTNVLKSNSRYRGNYDNDYETANEIYRTTISCKFPNEIDREYQSVTTCV